MFRFVIGKLFYSLLVLWGVATLVFVLFNAVGGNAADMSLGQRSDMSSQEAVNKEFGLNKPPAVRYLLYLNDLSILSFYSNENEAHGLKILPIGSSGIYLKAPYLRRSFQSRRPVSEIIAEGMKGTIVLAAAAMLLASLLGIGFGMVAALFKGRWQDRAIMLVSTLGISMPSFFAAVLIAWLFGYLLQSYTGLNMTGSLMDYSFENGEHIAWKNLILPALTLGIRPLAVIVQLTRSSLLDVLQQDYIRTARAKGLSEWTVLFKHALRNALNSVITAVSGWFASLMAGAFFVEYVFNWKGIGKTTVEALEKNDLPVLMGSVLTVAMFFVVINIVVDMAYKWLDPRVT